MAETYRSYPVVEVALSVQSLHESAGHERLQEGDIVECRPPSDAVGRLEMSRFLWLRLSGLEGGQYAALSTGVEGFEKRRYRIPLERLAAVWPGFDVARARDPVEVYQPCLGLDEDTGRYVWAAAPLEAAGLVQDVVTGEYL